MLKANLKRTIFREFRDYWWLFRMLHVSRYGARVGKEMMNNSDFRPFQVCRFKIVTTHCYYYCRLGKAHFYTQAFVPWRWYRRENANTVIGAAILKSGHPYIWATLPRAHNTWILKETEPMDACNYTTTPLRKRLFLTCTYTIIVRSTKPQLYYYVYRDLLIPPLPRSLNSLLMWAQQQTDSILIKLLLFTHSPYVRIYRDSTKTRWRVYGSNQVFYTLMYRMVYIFLRQPTISNYVNVATHVQYAWLLRVYCT